MAETLFHRSIDPNSFDLIVVGTGLSESILAAAASVNGKSVLHLDPNPFYGSHSASLSLESFVQFLESQQDPPISEGADCTSDDDCDTHLVKPCRLYSSIDVIAYAPQDLEVSSNRFCIDLSGPRVLFCADSLVDLLMKARDPEYLEKFIGIEGHFVHIEGKLCQVPDSREGIFKSRSLERKDKAQLMKFFNLVQQHFNSDENRISEEDLESPFVEFLTKQHLPQKIKS